MAGSTRIAAAVLLAALAPGCVTGHLWQAGRRWEQAERFRQAGIDGDRLVVRYDARVSDDDGVPLARQTRSAVVSLSSLRAAPVAAERVAVTPAGNAPVLPDHEVPIETAPPAEAGAPPSLVVHDARVPAVIPGNAFTRVATAGWVYPLLPLAFCVDATSMPVLLFFAPGAIVVGD